MLFAGIAADDKDAIGTFNLGDGVGHRSAAKGTHQTHHRRCVTKPGTVVNIVGANNCSGELHQSEVLFIGAFSR